MPGNRAIYDRAMEQVRAATTKQDWPRTLKEALRAIKEFPKDIEARVAVATGLYYTDKLAQSLQIFEELRNADPQNQVYLEWVARIKRQQGETQEAIARLIELAVLHQQRHLPLKAVEDLRQVLEIDPRHEEARIRLATLLAESGDTRGAIAELLTLGQQYLELGDLEGAEAAAQEALGLDARNKEALQLRSQAQAAREAAEAALLQERRPGTGRLGTGPLRSQSQIDAAMALATDLQSDGDIRGAIAQYERVLDAAPDRADAAYSLGLLYAEIDDAERAIAVLERAAHDDEYALSAHFTLGNIYQSLGKLDQAAQEYEQTLRLVNLESIGRDEAPDLIAMYESTAGVYEQLGDLARTASLYSTLAGFLQGKRWGREQAGVYNTKAKELSERSMFSKLRTLGTGALGAQPEPQPEPQIVKTETWGRIPSITDFLKPGQTIAEHVAEQGIQPVSEPADPLAVLEDLPEPSPAQPRFPPVTALDTTGCNELTQRYVEASGRFIEQGLFYAAIDACHEIIRHDFDYLSIHLRLGEIYERLNWQEQALTKYQVLIEAYEARGENQHAINVYYRLIELSPDSTTTRTRLAELLNAAGRKEEAAEQMAVVANTHYRMGQSSKALDEFRRLIQWAPNSKSLRAQYGQLLLKQERWEAAVSEFRRVVELDPEDPVSLAQLNIALTLSGEYPSAIWDSLATLLDRLQKQPGQVDTLLAEYRSMLLIVDRPILHYLIGTIEYATGRYPTALLALEQALALLELELDPMLPEVLIHQLMAECYMLDQQPDQAISELQRCLELVDQAQEPTTTSQPSQQPGRHFATPLSRGELQRNMAEAYAAAGDFQGAITALQEVKRLLPYDRPAYTKLAEIYFQQGQLQEALAQLDELATYYEQQQQLDRAIETLESAVTLAPNNVPVRNRLAHLYLRRGLLDKGLEALEELAQLQQAQGQIKDAVQSLQSAADVYWTLGRQERAYALYDRIVQMAPHDIEARSQLVNLHIQSFRLKDAVVEQKRIAQIFLQQRNYEEAIGAFHQVIALAPDDVETYEQLGEVLMRIGEYDQALRLYKRLSRLKPGDERVEALQTAAQRMIEQRETTT